MKPSLLAGALALVLTCPVAQAQAQGIVTQGQVGSNVISGAPMPSWPAPQLKEEYKELRLTIDPSRSSEFVAIFRNMSTDVSELEMMAPDGRRASVTWTNGGVTFGGDLPVDEAARIFFKYVGQLAPKCDKGN
jgi:hypothetical protein